MKFYSIKGMYNSEILHWSQERRLWNQAHLG